jgi:hypothetical protein
LAAYSRSEKLLCMIVWSVMSLLLLSQFGRDGGTLGRINQRFPYTLTQAQSAEILIGTILPQFRNERFHGNTRPPFRSSTATLKTYAHAYFLLIYSYALMLEVLLYRNFGVISVTGAGVNTTANLDRFLLVLGDQLTA